MLRVNLLARLVVLEGGTVIVAGGNQGEQGKICIRVFEFEIRESFASRIGGMRCGVCVCKAPCLVASGPGEADSMS